MPSGGVRHRPRGVRQRQQGHGLASVELGIDDAGAPTPQTISVVTHGSFAVSDSVLKEFTDRTGITVQLVKGDDAGAVVNQAILTKDHPQGDVLYGIDNTLLSKGLDNGLFEPYTSPSSARSTARSTSTVRNIASRRSTRATCASTTTSGWWRRRRSTI